MDALDERVQLEPLPLGQMHRRGIEQKWSSFLVSTMHLSIISTQPSQECSVISVLTENPNRHEGNSILSKKAVISLLFCLFHLPHCQRAV